MKEAGLRVRVESDLRLSFVAACRNRDMTASQVIRTFMRKYVEEAEAARQLALFPQELSRTK